MKLLVNTPSGLQQVIQIGEGGGYFDQSRVLWDERTDGQIPAITVGGMKRNGNSLEFDQQLLDAHNASLALQIPPAPTKEELLAQLNALSAQIQALE
jgi:hypothetical protein